MTASQTNRSARRAQGKARRLVGGAGAVALGAAAATAGAFGMSAADAATFAVTTTAATGPGSFQQAVLDANAAGGADTITFAAGVTGTIAVPANLTITDAVTITGPGASVLALSGGGVNRILYIKPATEQAVTISGLSFTAGFRAVGDASASGGAIKSVHADLTLEGTAFTGNVGGRYGGAVYLYDGDLSIANSTFADNMSYWDGGGVYVTNDNSGGHVVTVAMSKFTGNQAGDGAGALYSNGAPVSITDSTFSTNHANGSGGALNTNGDLTLTRSTFTGNTSNYSGGVLYSGEGTITVVDSTFTSNTADDDGGVFVFNDPGPLNISGSTFNQNKAGTAESSGRGGVVAMGTNNVDASSLTVANSTFTGNTATQQGGAVYLFSHDDTPGSIEIAGSAFTGNTSGRWGGALYSDGANVSITGSKFSENTAKSGAGAVNVTGVLLIGTSEFTDNTAVGSDGGAIRANGFGAKVTDSTFAGNTAAESGGALYFAGDVDGSSQTGALILQNVTITGNKASSGAALVVDEGELLADHATITYNTGEGAAVAVHPAVPDQTSKTASKSKAAPQSTSPAQAGTGNHERTAKPASAVTPKSIAVPQIEVVLAKDANLSNTTLYNPDSDNELDAATQNVFFSLVGSNPGLAPLANNGGPTRTMLPTLGSPLINAGDPAYGGPGAATTDQRGLPRISGAVTDIGAVEVQVPTITDPAGVTVTVGASASFTVSCAGDLPKAIQWYGSIDGGLTYTPITDATGLTLTIGTTVIANDGTLYRAVCTNPAGSAQSGPALLTVLGLAETGADTEVQLPIGIAVLALGGALVAGSRLRRRTSE